jgi:hypothetical protein
VTGVRDYAEHEIMQSVHAGGPVFEARQRAVLRIIPALGEMRSARLVP